MSEPNMPTELDRERRVFDTNYSTWAASPDKRGKFVLIKADDVIGFYNTLEEAFGAGTAKFGLAEFFIQAVAPPPTTNVSFLGRLM